MSPLVLLGFKALAGGIGVVLFAAIAEVVDPKKFAGLFSAAPSIALASLIISATDRGPASAAQSALGMVPGAAGMFAYCALGAMIIPRLGALRGSVVALLGWCSVAGGLYLALLR
jgi:uncharacterized membrane protein (GlpM family)